MMQHEIPTLDRQGLRRFGLLTGAIIAVLFGLLLPWLRGHSFSQWALLIAAILAVWAIAAPSTLNPVYRVWMRIGLVLGFINTRITLGVIFYALMWPMGVMMRWVGYDPLHRQRLADAETYRTASQVRLKKSMENPY